MLCFISGTIGLNIFALALILIRPKLFHTRLYKPMIKNLFLSILPIFIPIITLLLITILFSIVQTVTNNLVTVFIIIIFIGLIVWLLLLPNAGYLITELNLNHRESDLQEVPLYYDIIAVLILSIAGVMNTLVNVFFMELFIGVVLSPSNVYQYISGWQFVLLVILLYILVSIGIYLGRYLRFNSWDIIKPHRFIIKTYDHLTQRKNLDDMFIFIICYSVFFILMHFIVIQSLVSK